MSQADSAPLLTVDQLSVNVDGTPVLHDVSFVLAAGERLGIIGASGAGKTLLGAALAGLLPDTAEVRGSIRLGGFELLGLRERERARFRGQRIGVVFQEPKTALNPMQRLGRQLTEALALRYVLSRRQRREAALRLARQVGLTQPERMIRAYPHQVSGGQRQRAAIAAAIAAEPELLIADEPTTALDATVQRAVLQLFRELSELHGTALLFITHDLAVLAQLVDRVLVLDRGRVVEQAPLDTLIAAPQHATTRALLRAAGGVR